MADLVDQNPGEDRDASLIVGLPDLLDQGRRHIQSARLHAARHQRQPRQYRIIKKD
jgi:hypothetical protein